MGVGRAATGGRAYLAGPDVFFRDAAAIGAAKKAICAELGFEGVFPADGDPPLDDPHQLYAFLLDVMEGCDLAIANMTPFRGTAMDVGTAFEMGWFAGRGRPVLGYTSEQRHYGDRVTVDDGSFVEAFDLADNLMVGLAGEVVRVAADDPTAMAAFRACAVVAAARLGLATRGGRR